MKERIKKIRKELDLTQQAFANKLGVKRNTVGQWECGVNAVTDQTITAICREFNINEEWMRTGNGKMFLPKDRYTEIANLTKKLINEEPDSFKNRLVSVLANLTEDQWELLADIATKLVKEKD